MPDLAGLPRLPRLSRLPRAVGRPSLRLFAATTSILASAGATTLSAWAGSAPNLAGLDGTYAATPGGSFVVSSGTITFNPSGAFGTVLAGLTQEAEAVIGRQLIRATVTGTLTIPLTLIVHPSSYRVLGAELQTSSIANMANSALWFQVGKTASGPDVTWTGQFGEIRHQNGAVPAGIMGIAAGEYLRVASDVQRLSGNTRYAMIVYRDFSGGTGAEIHPFYRVFDDQIVFSGTERRTVTLDYQTPGPVTGVTFAQDRNASGFGTVRVHGLSVRKSMTGALAAGQAVTLSTALGISYAVDPGAAMSVVAGAGTLWVLANAAAANTLGAVTLAGGGSITLTAGASTLSVRLLSGAYDQTISVPWDGNDRVKFAFWLGNDGSAHLRTTNFAGGWHEASVSLTGWMSPNMTAVTLCGPTGIGLSRTLTDAYPARSFAVGGTAERGASGAVRLYSDTGNKGAFLTVWDGAAGVAEATIDTLQAATPDALEVA